MTEVSVSRDGVEEDEPPSSSWIENIVHQVLSITEIQEQCEISILLTSDVKMRELNSEYRGLDKTTDVLSFAFEEEQSIVYPKDMPRILGDVILSLPQIERQASENRGTYSKECAWALCHGLLHLLGYDHQTDAQESEMRALENKILNSLGELTW